MKEKGRENCYISEITVFELRLGAENSDYFLKSHKAVDDFVNGLSIIPIYGCIKRYGKEKVRLRKIGKPMHDEFDLLIGVSAVENKLTLVTDNLKDFKNIEKIKIENGSNANSTPASKGVLCNRVVNKQPKNQLHVIKMK